VQPVVTQSIAPHPLSPDAQKVATVPGQSASNAAPAALAELKQSATGTTVPVPQPNLNAKPPAGQAAAAPANPAAAAGQGVKLMLSPPGQVATGSTFQVPVVISNATDISSVPLQITYDPSKLELVNVGAGDFLTRDGQAAALVHRDDGPGTITINASRPPGTPGVSGAGVVSMLSFQAKAPGQTTIAITRPGAISSSQKPVPAQGSQITVNVK
jgi:general secretion pathway protein D